MHEYSIVQSLLDQCEQYAKVNDASKITKVVVKIGRLSGVEPHLLKVAFDTFKEKTICDSAEFVLNYQQVIIRCNCCDSQSELIALHYLCPKCQSSDIKVIGGEEMLLMSLEME